MLILQSCNFKDNNTLFKDYDRTLL